MNPIETVKAALEDMVALGLRHDLNPCRDMTSRETVDQFWRQYMRSADELLRQRAQNALDALAAQEPAIVAACCGRTECGGECGNEWQGMRPAPQPAPPQPAVPESFEKALDEYVAAVRRDGILRQTKLGPEAKDRVLRLYALAAGAAVKVPQGMLDRVKAASQRIHDGHALRRIPADPTDVDLVLAEVHLWLEGKPAPCWLTAAAQSPTQAGL